MHFNFSNATALAALISIPFHTGNAQSEPFQHKFGELREYHKHWLAICPNRYDPKSTADYERTCWASTYIGKPDFFLDGRLSVSRDRQNGTYKITFVTDAYERLKRTDPVSVRFSDGMSMDFTFDTSVRNTQSINEFQMAIENPTEMVAAMKRSNRMTLTLPTTDGDETAQYSMIGLTAALEFTKKYALPGSYGRGM